MRVSLFLLSPRCYRACLCSQHCCACQNHQSKYSHTHSAQYQCVNLCPRAGSRQGQGTCFKHVCMQLFSHVSSCYRQVKEACVGLIIGQRVLLLPDKHGSRTKCNAWPSICSHQTPCLSLESSGAVLDHSPCIDQSKWNDLSGTQWPDLM